jgi:hypothetical protein
MTSLLIRTVTQELKYVPTIGCPFKFLLKVAESIVNTPRITDHESAV